MKPNMKNTLAVVTLLALLLNQFFYAPQTVSAATCDAALFIADVTVPDDTVFPPTTNFVKTWRLKNVGTCTWTTSYKLAFAGGTQLSGPEEAPLSMSVPPGAMVDVSVNLVSLAGNGTYRGYWQLKNAAGTRFGIGPAADKFFWVEIVVRNGITASTPIPQPVGMSDNFALSAGAARWQSGAGQLTFPGTEGDARGFVRKLDSVTMETGQAITQPSLLMVPQNKTDGYIQGLFPAIAIQYGDRFQATIGCQYGATSCYVTYRIDVRTSAGVRTLWTFKERYEGLTYNVNLDLSSLAGKNTEFFLMVLASGSPTGDQAVWIAPRITHLTPSPTPTVTPTPTITPTPTATTPRLVTATIEVDQPVFGVCGISNPVNVVAMVTAIAPATVTYHWELTADKTIITPDATLTFSAAGTQSVAPAGYGADCGVNYLARIIITSPNFYSAGIYYSVVGPTPPPITPDPAGGYNFALSGSSAAWQSGAGGLTFPGVDGDARGFAQTLTSFQMETGATINDPSLLMVPQNKTDGYIQALFPAQVIQAGDRFQTTIGCQYGATSCYVTYRIDTRNSAGTKTLWSFKEKYEGLTYNVNLDLSSLAGKNTEFFLLVLASGSPTGDRAIWIAPRIVHAGGVIPSATPLPTLTLAATPTPIITTETATTMPPPTPMPTLTVTPAHGNWVTYTDTVYGFQFQYPLGSQSSDTHIMLPIAPGTNLSEKYLDVNVAQNASVCTSPLTSGYAPGSFTSVPVSFNGIAFVKESGSDAGMGQLHQWTAYSTMKNGNCISLSFVLHSTNPGNYPTPPPTFDESTETAVFDQILSTFGMLSVP